MAKFLASGSTCKKIQNKTYKIRYLTNNGGISPFKAIKSVFYKQSIDIFAFRFANHLLLAYKENHSKIENMII